MIVTPMLARLLSADRLLLGRLRRDGQEATVHSVFDRVVNLRGADDGRLFSLAARNVDDAPDTLILDIGSCRDLRLHVGDRVIARQAALITPTGAIALSGARPWDARLPPLPLPPDSLDWLRRFLRHDGAPPGSPADADPVGRAWGAAIDDRLAAHIDGLLEGLRRGAAGDLTHHAVRLIGLGPGLTPSGDDILLGIALVTTMRASKLKPYQDLLARVVEKNVDRTNDISYAALVHATHGRARESVAALLRAMAGGEGERQLTLHGRGVAAMGHRSGTDILTGLSAALHLEHQLRGEQAHGSLRGPGGKLTRFESARSWVSSLP